MISLYITVWTIIIALSAFCINRGQALLCYRCDSQLHDDCQYYPSPVSLYESCDDRPVPTYLPSPSNQQQSLYIRYQYMRCPILERTIYQTLPMTTTPMEIGSYVCGKAVTHGPNGLRVRRGCTPDLFLNGTDACVQIHPDGNSDVACFCTTNFCNGALPSSLASSIPVFLIIWTIAMYYIA